MSTNSPQPPSEEEARFKEAMRRILSLTPEQREEIRRKVAPPAKGEQFEPGAEDKVGPDDRST